jgi:hypothetical protein
MMTVRLEEWMPKRGLALFPGAPQGRHQGCYQHLFQADKLGIDEKNFKSGSYQN